jgi:hypothetical protein
MNNSNALMLIFGSIWFALYYYLFRIGKKSDELLDRCKYLYEDMIKEQLKLLEMKKQYEQMIKEVEMREAANTPIGPRPAA